MANLSGKQLFLLILPLITLPTCVVVNAGDFFDLGVRSYPEKCATKIFDEL